MSNPQELISLYHTMFYVFMGLTIFFVVIAVLLFFVFNIRGNIAAKTGYAEKATLKKMTGSYATTGSLRKQQVSMEFTTGNLQAYANQVEQLDTGSEETSQLAPNKRPDAGVAEQPTAASKSVTASAPAPVPAPVPEAVMQPVMMPQEPVSVPGFAFNIFENIMVIHTNELI